MALTGFSEFYSALVKEFTATDPRTEHLPLMQGLLPVFLIEAVYFSFCLKWGPKLMENRRPFELKKTLVVYNAANVVFSVWMFYEGLASGWWNDYSFKCQLVDYSDNPKATRMARLTYIYFICKLVELLDTVFFVLRKKNNQITVLHLYHHSGMPVISFLAAKMTAGGSATFGILLNSFVHSVMYSYYLLAGLGPRYQKYLWWKAHLTKLQLIQFLLVIVQQILVLRTDCKFPKAVPVMQISSLCVLFFLFLSFYRRSYRKTSGKIGTMVNKLK